MAIIKNPLTLVKQEGGGTDTFAQWIEEENATSITTNATKIASKKFSVASTGSQYIKLTSFSGQNVEEIGEYAFYNQKSLVTKIKDSFPNLKTIHQYAFLNCTSITEIDMPDGLITLEQNSFSSCTNVAKITVTAWAANVSSTQVPLLSIFGTTTLSSLKTIIIKTTNIPNNGLRASSGTNPIETVDAQNVTTIGQNAFSNCDLITSLDLPNVTSVAGFGFYYMHGLTSINLPKVEQLDGNTFANCSALTTVSFPKVKVLSGANTFNGCNALTSISFDALEHIKYAWGTSSALADITIGTNAVCQLDYTSCLPASANQHITIHVPNDLIASYQIATNWSTLYNNGYIDFVAIV